MKRASYVFMLWMLQSYCVAFEPSLEHATIKEHTAALQRHVSYLFVAVHSYDAIASDMVSSPIENNSDFLHNKLVGYQHELIKKCIAMMLDESSLQPFFMLWNRYIHGYVPVDQKDLFLKECATLLFTFYTNMLHTVIQDETTARVTIEEIVQLYEAVNALPMIELIELLDRMLDKLTSILDEHKIKPGQTIIGWIYENWWVPPVVIGTILINIIGI